MCSRCGLCSGALHELLSIKNFSVAGLPCRERLVNENDFVIDNAANSGDLHYVS